MTYHRFEDLTVWQEAIRLAAKVYALTEDAAFQKQYSLRDRFFQACSLSQSTKDDRLNLKSEIANLK